MLSGQRGKMEPVYYINVLNQSFHKKREANKRFSLRSYAKFLGISHSTLSAILNNKRPLPLSYIEKICFKLNLTEDERKDFFKSVIDGKMTGIIPSLATGESKTLDDKTYFTILTEWEHFAILSLLDLDNFIPTMENICKKIDIEKSKILQAIQRLKKVCFLEESAQKEFKRTTPRLNTTEDLFSKAIQVAHKKELILGLKKIEEVSVDKRDFSSITMPTNTKNLMKAKALIRKFRKDMSSLVENGEKSEVYKLCIQFFPLTTPVKKT